MFDAPYQAMWIEYGYTYWWTQSVIANYNYEQALANMIGFASRPF